MFVLTVPNSTIIIAHFAVSRYCYLVSRNSSRKHEMLKFFAFSYNTNFLAGFKFSYQSLVHKNIMDLCHKARHLEVFQAVHNSQMCSITAAITIPLAICT